MKIQINSLEALERLIGGDTDVEIQVRNSVVQNFTNRYLKGIAKEYTDAGIIQAIRKSINDDVFAGGNNYYNVNITDKYKEKLKEVVEFNIKQLIREQVDLILKDKPQLIEDIVKSQISYYVDKQVATVTKEVVDAKVKQQIFDKFK